MSLFYTKTFWISFLLIVLAFLLGLTAGRIGLKPGPAQVPNQPTQTYPPGTFSMQTAVVKGRIVKTDSSTLTVISSSQVKATFPLSQRVYITKYDSLGKPSVSLDLKGLELNKDASINLELVPSSNKYFVLAITYIPPFPGSQKTATSTPKL